MKKISVDFYGEEVSIQLPKDFASLRQEIAQKYELSFSDISEIDITYLKHELKKVIKSEIDFKIFAHSKIVKITLEINESSKLYQKSLLDLQNKTKDNMARLT